MNIQEAAQIYIGFGLSVLPVRGDGSKAPDYRHLPIDPETKKPSWKPFQTRAPGPDEVPALFNGADCIGVIGGKVSGGLEVIDFEDEQALEDWNARVYVFPCVKLLPVVKTPGRPGAHVYLKSAGCERGEKLAKVKDKSRGHDGLIIETRGEGQYVVCPPSPGWSHASGPPVCEVPVISVTARNALIGLARGLGDQPVPVPPEPGAELTPCDDFDQRGTFAEILEPRGWTLVYSKGDVEHWKRPGKEKPGHSATVGFCFGDKGEPLIYIFSTNADPLEPLAPYGRARLLAALEHGGDLSACAGELRRRGYGSAKRPPELSTRVDTLAPATDALAFLRVSLKLNPKLLRVVKRGSEQTDLYEFHFDGGKVVSFENIANAGPVRRGLGQAGIQADVPAGREFYPAVTNAIISAAEVIETVAEGESFLGQLARYCGAKAALRYVHDGEELIEIVNDGRSRPFFLTDGALVVYCPALSEYLRVMRRLMNFDEKATAASLSKLGFTVWTPRGKGMTRKRRWRSEPGMRERLREYGYDSEDEGALDRAFLEG